MVEYRCNCRSTICLSRFGSCEKLVEGVCRLLKLAVRSYSWNAPFSRCRCLATSYTIRLANALRDGFEELLAWASFLGSTECKCIWSGTTYVREHLSKDFQKEYPTITTLTEIVIPSLVAAAVSHPADLMTGLLNGDPQKQKYPTYRATARSLYQSRGLQGITVGFFPRFVALSIEVGAFSRLRSFYEKHL